MKEEVEPQIWRKSSLTSGETVKLVCSADKMGALSPGFLVWDMNNKKKGTMKSNGRAINGGKASMSFDMEAKVVDKKISSVSADAVMGRYSVLSWYSY